MSRRPLPDAFMRGVTELSPYWIGVSGSAPSSTNALTARMSPRSMATAGHVEFVRMLVAKGAKVNATGPGAESPLAAATKAGNAEIIEILKARGAK